MPSWGHHEYGPTGGELIGEAFDRWAEGRFFASSPDSKRGFQARVTYLLQHRGGVEAMAARGITPKGSRVVEWLTGDVRPQRKTRAGIDAAYREVRRHNLARTLRTTLADGRLVSVEPLDPSQVPADRRTRQAQFEDREFRIGGRDWTRFVDAWEDDDANRLDQVWMDVAADLGSPPEAYWEVSHVGFAI